MATYAYDPETANPKAPERPTLMVKDEDSVIVERYIKKRRLELNDDDAPKKDRTGDAAGVRRTLADLKRLRRQDAP
jgi:hypothetical protein